MNALLRARSQGICISSGTLSPKHRATGTWKAVAAAGIAASLLIGGFFAVKKSQPRQQSVRNDFPVVLKSDTLPVPPHLRSSVEVENKVSKLERQLSQAQTKIGAMSVQIKAGRIDLEEKKQELASLQEELRQQRSNNIGMAMVMQSERSGESSTRKVNH